MSAGPCNPALVLVTGAAGVMGRRLVQGLLHRGARVRCLVLPRDPGQNALRALGCDVIEGDLARSDSLQPATDGVETVYHLAAVILSHDPSVFRSVNLEGTRRLAHAATASGVRHFIYVSSASVTYPRRTPYAESKFAAEDVVRAARSFEYTIVRPTLVYDEHGGQEFVMFRDFVLRYPVVPFVGAGSARKRPVFSEDVVRGLLALLDNPKSYGKTYNFSGGQSISLLDLARLILRHHGQERQFVHIPEALCRFAAKLAEASMKKPPLTESAIAGLTNHADLDPSEATADLGYQPLGVYAGFERCFPITLQRGPRPVGTKKEILL